MIKKLYIIILICVFCAACGVKNEPEYKTKVVYINATKIA